MKKSKGITLIALVITIIILLILAGVTIQVTFGENGLLNKAENAKTEQAKAELLETVKETYISIRLNDLKNSEGLPIVEKVLGETNLKNKYEIQGDNITDKQGNIIERKENIVKIIEKLEEEDKKHKEQENSSSESHEEEEEKVIAGYRIRKQDKAKLILKLIIKKKTNISFGKTETLVPSTNPQSGKVEFEDGTSFEFNATNNIFGKEFEPGEHIIKFENPKNLGVGNPTYGNPSYRLVRMQEYSIDVISWGEEWFEKGKFINETDRMELYQVDKIHSMEPDNLCVRYMTGLMTEIPEDLFINKRESRVSSTFFYCERIRTIPKGLFRNATKLIRMNSLFYRAISLREIPEDLFKYNTEVTEFKSTFSGCIGLRNIPEDIFKYNTKAKLFDETFYNTRYPKAIDVLKGIQKYVPGSTIRRIF